MMMRCNITVVVAKRNWALKRKESSIVHFGGTKTIIYATFFRRINHRHI
jgi:hypothetical protein